jgi:predicted TIM-barrel fold metal-dependent hydrolase
LYAEYEGQYPGQIPPYIVAGLFTNFHARNSTSPLLVLRWYLAGVFDRHPSLRIILSQKGHDIPTLFPQIDSFLASLPVALNPKRTFQDVWQTNFYVTTADTVDLAGMRALIERTPLNRILYAGGEQASNLMSDLKESGMLSNEEYERIAWKNAEVLFGLKGNEKFAGPSANRKIPLEKLAFFNKKSR